jgi:branched-chain amino acid transport system permease protein
VSTVEATQSPLAAPAALRSPTELWFVRALAGGGATSALFVALMILLFETGSLRTQQVILIFLAYLMVALGLQVFTGNSGVISFGHVGLMAIGAYVAELMNLSPTSKAGQIGGAPDFIKNAHFGFLPATLIAIVVTCIFALPFGFAFARLSGTAAAIATLAGYEIAITVIANWDTVTHGTFTLYGESTYGNHTLFWWSLAFAAVAIVLARLFREAGIGLALRATSADELVARAIGVNMPRVRLAAWVISAGFAAAGGALYMKFLGALAPTTFSFDPVVIVTLIMFIVGGRSVSGVVIGATMIAVIDEGLKRVESSTGRAGIEIIGLAAIFTMTMIFRPQGLLGRWEIDELAARWWRGRRTEAGRRRGREVT